VEAFRGLKLSKI